MITIRRQKTKLDKLVIDNIREVNEFLFTHIPTNKKQSASNEFKLRVECPYCGDNSHKLNLALNLDWGSFKCFKCGKTGTVVDYLKEFDLDNDYVDLLSNLSSTSIYDILTLLKTNRSKRYIDTVIKDNKENLVKQFVDKKGLLPIKKLDTAKKYALDRVYNSEDEIEGYYADDLYVYIPLFTEEKIAAFIARLYVDSDSPRYKMHTIDKSVKPIGFYDEVANNFNSNSLFITEGYFDAFAINYAFSNYVGIALLGKNKINSCLAKLEKNFACNTKIYVVLDSDNKDKEIIKDNIEISKKLMTIFPNVFICPLTEGDPASLLKEKGSIYLKEYLQNKNKIIPALKYSILHSGKSR